MISLLLFLSISKASAEDYYIKSLKAPLLGEARAGSKILAALDRNAQVTGLGKEGVFVKVKSNNLEGYVNSLFLSSTPSDSKSILAKENVDIASKARKRASGFTSAAAARGLKEDSDEIFKSLGDANPDQIKKMETFLVDERQGIKFLFDPNLKLQ